MGFGSKRGGTKVPGLKLKPHNPPQVPTVQSLQITKKKGKEKEKRHENYLKEEDDDEDSRALLESIRNDKPPLIGLVISFSGIHDPVKSQAVEYAEKLGAKVEKALTLDVTHLICENSGSQKYNVALQHGIKIMLPLWLETLYSSFTEGEEIEFEDITKRYTMKPLHNLKLSITGRTPSRTPFIRLAEDNGASISMDLDSACSHLVVFSRVNAGEIDPEIFESEKVQAAFKAKTIKVVWQEWLEDSVAKGGCLPEDAYLVREGFPRPGCSTDKNSKETPAKKQVDENGSYINHVDEVETAVTRKSQKSGNQNAILASIILQEDIPLCNPKSERRLKPIKSSTLNFLEGNDLLLPPSSLASIPNSLGKAETSLKTGLSQPSKIIELPQKFDTVSVVKRLSSIKSEKFSRNGLGSSDQAATPKLPISNPHLFEGLKISTYGCPPRYQRLIREAVVESGGQNTDIHSEADFTIVPHINPPYVPADCNPVAHSWLEQSLYNSKIIDPDQHWAARPLRLNPIAQREKYSFACCGYDEAEQEIIKRTLDKLHLKLNLCAQRSEVTHIFIGPNKSSSRARKVMKWTEKQFVDIEWLIGKCNGHRISRSNPPDNSIGEVGVFRQVCDNLPVEDISHLESPPLLGCVIYLTKRAQFDENSRYLTNCRKLGAKVVERLTDSVTHLVHVSERVNDLSREVKIARTKKIRIVHPKWLTECSRRSARADEETFLPTYKPGRALEYTAFQDLANVTILGEDIGQEDTILTVQVGEKLNRSSLGDQSIPNLNNESVWQSTPRTAEPFKKNTLDPDKSTHSNENIMKTNAIEEGTPELMKWTDTPDRPPRFDHFTSSHSHGQEAASSSPSQKMIPGVDTQIGGFMQILQSRNQHPETSSKKSKDYDGRRVRKRSLGQDSRSTSICVSSKGCSASDGQKTSSIGNRLNRTFSDFSLESAPDSQIDLDENVEESMRVTWEDPAAKREILKAINDPSSRTTKKLADRRKHREQLAGELIAGIKSTPRENKLEKNVDEPSVREVSLAYGSQTLPEIEPPPLKRRKPVLVELD
ncbi:expressed protein [Phakopsora pachyrhizi]|uniref:Expressed protein n=1 Tax=Phakopsora pachyrhizi TaxID=170000 RepID=A0AAV0BM65_PHAPC|nr:expressed protein [Phakopsora pachyrhizi]